MIESLTPRDRDVMRLAAEGLTNAAIGRRLGLSMHTAKTHIARACRRAGVRDRAALVDYAWRHGVVGDRAALAAEVVRLRAALDQLAALTALVAGAAEDAVDEHSLEGGDQWHS